MNDVAEAVALLIAVYGLIFFALWGVPATWERICTARYDRETARLDGRTPSREWHPLRRTNLFAALVAELAVRACFWLAAKVLRLDREAGHRAE